MQRSQRETCFKTEHSRELSPAFNYENNMQVQRANSARKKKCPARRKFLIHNPAAITKSRTAHRHFLLSAHPSFTIFAPCTPEDVGFPARLEHHGPPLCPHCASVLRARISRILSDRRSERRVDAACEVVIDRRKSNRLKCTEFRNVQTRSEWRSLPLPHMLT